MRQRTAFRTWVGVLTLLIALVTLGVATASASNTNPKISSDIITPKAPSTQSAIDRLQGAVGDTATVSLNNATGVVQFVRLTPGTLLLAGSTSEERAADFFVHWGDLFGVRDAASQLRLVSSKTDGLTGMSHLTYQQVHNGVDVFAGIMKLHFLASGDLSSANGVFVPNVDVSTLPIVQESVAGSLAKADIVANPHREEDGTSEPIANPNALVVHATTLVVYRAGLAQDVSGLNHLTYAVEVREGGALRELVYVDAHSGKVIDRVSLSHDALFRRVYEQNTGNQVWQEGDAFPGTLNIDQQNIVQGSGESYWLFNHAFGWDSYNNAGAEMRTVNNDPTIACPNANWNGATTNYCNGVTSDDVVAHEWGHAYTEYTSNLIYQWQPGALNESYSDIWGETADILNGRQTDVPGGVRTGTACFPASGSLRWLMGEDSTAFGGAIRDMWNPNCEGNDPGRVTDPLYVCSTGDGGGVHSNSGVPNHGYALLVDGGTYNSQTITGIGLTKAAHIYWRAQEQYQVPSTDFADHADALEQACADLATASTNLPGLGTTSTNPGPSGQVISAGDCTQLAAVIAAVELRTEPTQCNFQPMFEQNPPALCAGFSQPPITVYEDDFETGLDGWTLDNQGVFAGWPELDWEISTDLPFGVPGAAAFAIDPQGGNCDAGAGDWSGNMWMDSPVIPVPDTTGGAFRLAFDHSAATELGWDGGNLKYRVNAGTWTVVPASAFIYNDYPRNLNTAGQGNTNPLAGQPSFTGTDGGSVETQWGQSQVNLQALGAGFGDTIQFRYDFGMDGCSGVAGWYVDNLEVYACYNQPTAVEVSVLATAPAAPKVSVMEMVAAGILVLSASGLFLLRRSRK